MARDWLIYYAHITDNLFCSLFFHLDSYRSSTFICLALQLGFLYYKYLKVYNLLFLFTIITFLLIFIFPVPLNELMGDRIYKFRLCSVGREIILWKAYNEVHHFSLDLASILLYLQLTFEILSHTEYPYVRSSMLPRRQYPKKISPI